MLNLIFSLRWKEEQSKKLAHRKLINLQISSTQTLPAKIHLSCSNQLICSIKFGFVSTRTIQFQRQHDWRSQEIFARTYLLPPPSTLFTVHLHHLYLVLGWSSSWFCFDGLFIFPWTFCTRWLLVL